MDVKRLLLFVLVLSFMVFTIVACAPADRPEDNPGTIPQNEEQPGEVLTEEVPNDRAPEDQTPRGPEPGEVVADAPAVPHAVDGAYLNCAQCHTALEETHTGMGDITSCTNCHQPS